MNWGILMLVLYVALILLGFYVFWIIGVKIFKIKESMELQEEILEELKQIKSKVNG